MLFCVRRVRACREESAYFRARRGKLISPLSSPHILPPRLEERLRDLEREENTDGANF